MYIILLHSVCSQETVLNPRVGLFLITAKAPEPGKEPQCSDTGVWKKKNDSTVEINPASAESTGDFSGKV